MGNLRVVCCPFCGEQNGIEEGRRCAHYLLRTADEETPVITPLGEPLRYRVNALCVAREARARPGDSWITQRLFLRGDIVIVHERQARGVRGHYFISDPNRKEAVARLLVDEWTNEDGHPV